MALTLQLIRTILAFPRRFSHLITSPVKRRFFRVTFKPARQSVSQPVLDMADRMIEEYKSDLDYLKDR